jgi:hypothetical protein
MNTEPPKKTGYKTLPYKAQLQKSPSYSLHKKQSHKPQPYPTQVHKKHSHQPQSHPIQPQKPSFHQEDPDFCPCCDGSATAVINNSINFRPDPSDPSSLQRMEQKESINRGHANAIVNCDNVTIINDDHP